MRSDCGAGGCARSPGGRFVKPAHERRTVEEVIEDYWKHLHARGAKAVGRSRSHINHVIAALGHVRAIEMRGPMVEAWALEMLADGYARATVNNGITYLKAALRLAHKHEQLATLPYLSLRSLNNAGQGFSNITSFSPWLSASTPYWRISRGSVI